MSERFYPARGKVAIEKDEVSSTTSSGIIYTKNEMDVRYLTGVVRAVGQLNINNKGILIPVDYKTNDRILFEAVNQSTIHGYIIINQDQVHAVLDKDVEVSG